MDGREAQTCAATSTATASPRQEQADLSNQEKEEQPGKETEAFKAEFDGCGEAGGSSIGRRGSHAMRGDARAPEFG